MKSIPALLVLGIALSLCNIANRIKQATSSNEPGNTNKSSSTADSGGTAVEAGQPTAAQTAALAGGQEIKWDQQGMSWTVPAKWRESTVESKMLVWTSPGTPTSLIVNISPMDENFPFESSLNAYYESAKSRAKNGEVDEAKWVEIDGLKGVQFRESNPEQPDDHRRLHWIAYRKYAGQLQMVNLMLATQGKDFARDQDVMYGILYSTKLVH